MLEKALKWTLNLTLERVYEPFVIKAVFSASHDPSEIILM